MCKGIYPQTEIEVKSQLLGLREDNTLKIDFKSTQLS